MSRDEHASLLKSANYVEMRVGPRKPILQRCFVYPARKSAPQVWRCIAYNISTTGIAIALPMALPQGTILSVEPWDLPKAPALRVRIIHARTVDFYWFTGCELLKRLSETELEAWCSGSIDWPQNHECYSKAYQECAERPCR